MTAYPSEYLPNPSTSFLGTHSSERYEPNPILVKEFLMVELNHSLTHVQGKLAFTIKCFA